MKRLEVRFRGQVQGVGFRYTTLRIATRWSVTGYVENTPDGGVYLLAEGPAATLEAFLAEVLESMQSHVEDHHASWQAARGEYATFE
ncbi:MAG: acylphosphatase, partial [Pirellulaceae bacterium]